IARNLIAAGLAARTPVLAIENASLPDERIVRTRLDLLEIAARALGAGPALLLIGDAVGVATPAMAAVSVAEKSCRTDAP
ncbi:MAG: uroporphyrinogen-III C-methyltransferase, partial [Sphingobium sp.]